MTPPDQPISSLEGAFTKGPWSTTPGGRIICQTGNGHLTTVWARAEEMTLADIQANARLIAAAPALVEALTKIRNLSEPGQELDIDGAIDVLCDVWNVARAALLQALGAEK